MNDNIPELKVEELTDFHVKLIEHLREKFKKGCACCGCDNLAVDARIYYLKEYKDDLGLIVPDFDDLKRLVVPVICRECGNMMFIDPRAAKLIRM